jgi:transcriptional regulator with XRE-family HTH domain
VLRLRALGFTYQAVADAAGLTRGRVAQIVSRAASPA